ncbi:unnamed protein product [Brassica rapa subsp. trilocularis]
MIGRFIPFHRKAFTLVQPRITLFLSSSAFSVLISDDNVSYKERLRSEIVGIKKDNAVGFKP